MKSKIIFALAHLGLLLAGLNWPVSVLANVTVTVTTVPQTPNGQFSAAVAGASINDPTPNPCYGLRICELSFYTIDESWLPNGKQGYTTQDQTGWSYGSAGETTATHRTIGAWWASVTDKGRIAKDYLPSHHGSKPCVVLAAKTTYGMEFGTIVSNCARGLVQVPSCSLTPPTIEVALSAMTGLEAQERQVPDVNLTCTQPVSVRIETNTNGEIPVGGDSSTVAVLDWGQGYGRPSVIQMAANETRPIPLKVMTRGISRLSPGRYTGSAVVNVVYE